MVSFGRVVHFLQDMYSPTICRCGLDLLTMQIVVDVDMTDSSHLQRIIGKEDPFIILYSNLQVFRQTAVINMFVCLSVLFESRAELAPYTDPDKQAKTKLGKMTNKHAIYPLHGTVLQLCILRWLQRIDRGFVRLPRASRRLGAGQKHFVHRLKLFTVVL